MFYVRENPPFDSWVVYKSSSELNCNLDFLTFIKFCAMIAVVATPLASFCKVTVVCFHVSKEGGFFQLHFTLVCLKCGPLDLLKCKNPLFVWYNSGCNENLSGTTQCLLFKVSDRSHSPSLTQNPSEKSDK